MYSTFVAQELNKSSTKPDHSGFIILVDPFEYRVANIRYVNNALSVVSYPLLSFIDNPI